MKGQRRQSNKRAFRYLITLVVLCTILFPLLLNSVSEAYVPELQTRIKSFEQKSPPVDLQKWFFSPGPHWVLSHHYDEIAAGFAVAHLGETSHNTHTFISKETDSSTGLIYFGARFYDPAIGRFLAQDPLTGTRWEPRSLHRYGYGFNNPLMYIDEYGYKAKLTTFLLTGGKDYNLSAEEERALHQRLARENARNWNADTYFDPMAGYQAMVGCIGLVENAFYLGYDAGRDMFYGDKTDNTAWELFKQIREKGVIDTTVEGISNQIDAIKSGDAYAAGELMSSAYVAGKGIYKMNWTPKPFVYPTIEFAVTDIGSTLPMFALETATVMVPTAESAGLATLGLLSPTLLRETSNGEDNFSENTENTHSSQKNNNVKVNPEKAKFIREAKGKGNNVEVKTQKEAEALIEEARPELEWKNTYEKPKYKAGKEIHPSDGSGVDKPHIKWKDWSKGKKDGAEGHIYFDEM